MTTLLKPVRRVANSTLDGSFGPDRNRRLVITLIPGDGKAVADLIELRPQGTRRPEAIAALDVYRYAIRCRANRAALEKARARKERKAERLAGERVARADRKLRQQLKAERQ